MREEIGYMVKDISDQGAQRAFTGRSISGLCTGICQRVRSDRHHGRDIQEGFGLQIERRHDRQTSRSASADEEYEFEAVGNGRLDAISNALKMSPYTFDYKFVTYSEHALSAESQFKGSCVCLHRGSRAATPSGA